jgi:hypothetical protein
MEAMKLDRLQHGLAGDRQFLAVIILGNLFYAAIPLVWIIVLALAWWFLT